ncbi:HAD-IIA family hydrolase [Paenibacillus sp. GCM10027626]|uniref:HAD-IIA family hydrolase n=1 Tax=Paenibacillus sp. GCM10027626 TaxID=3273411 RepID=UPI0036451E55
MSMRKLGGLLIDLDGTLYHGNTMIDGADRLIRGLERLNLPYLFVTNNSSAAPEAVAERLKSMGIPAEPQHVCTSAQAAAAYICDRYQDGRVFVVGEHGLEHALLEAGLQVVQEKPNVVVQGIDRHLTYERLAAAVSHIRSGADYILTNPDVLLPSDKGFIPGAGSISAMLERASGAEPTVIGKPSAIMMNYALSRIGLPVEQVWVIGDNPATDIAAAHAVGCRSALVLTGLATETNYKELLGRANCHADEVIGDLHLLLQRIEQLSSP